MSKIFIVPAGTILSTHGRFENIFCFYNGGVKEIIRQHFLKSASFLFDFYSDNQRTVEEEKLLLDILQQYDTSVHRSYIEMNHKGYDVADYIESLVDAIHYDVRKTMYRALHQRIVEVKRAAWLGHDMMFETLKRVS